MSYKKTISCRGTRIIAGYGMIFGCRALAVMTCKRFLVIRPVTPVNMGIMAECILSPGNNQYGAPTSLTVLGWLQVDGDEVILTEEQFRYDK